ncbi:SPOCS domain-containing protein [Eubacterium multiforme]|uniref:LysM repeat protein n=1 Tax=Eubacterium multiforme TaxID=83339 RepID=A0ABT9UQB6_9FIRM|nr:SPOCS domain-containing protein [Eubacterium multiforme]MDQ0148840.1 LysM repeat protein [Eubacterium multiforme]
MAKIDVIKENIKFEQLLRESNTTSMLNDEYLIPDTHPDVEKLLMVDAKPTVMSKETVGDKVMVEGRIEYNVLYLAKEESTIVSSVNYSQKFNSSLDLQESEHKIICEVECRVEHIEAQIINERKIAIDGVLNFNWEMYEGKELELVKDVSESDGVEVLKKNEAINNKNASENIEIIGKSMIRVSMDKPPISKVLKSKMELQKKEVKIGEEKVYCGCYCKFGIIYLSNESKEVYYLEDNIYLSKEMEMAGVTPDMLVTADFNIKNKDITVEEDDLGEARIVNTEVLVICSAKVFSKKNIDVIVDAYSPKFKIEVSRDEHNIGMLQGIYNNESIIKDNIYINEGNMMPEKIITNLANVILTDKSVAQDKIKVSGYIKVNVIYKTNDEETYLDKVSGDIPFNISIDANGANENMKALVKASIENLDVAIEANTISIKANIDVIAKVLFEIKKEFVSDIVEREGEEIKKKASITIYVVGEGDTLWKLAKKYHTTMNEIIKINELEDADKLIVGEKLLIPGRAVS